MSKETIIRHAIVPFIMPVLFFAVALATVSLEFRLLYAVTVFLASISPGPSIREQHAGC